MIEHLDLIIRKERKQKERGTYQKEKEANKRKKERKKGDNYTHQMLIVCFNRKKERKKERKKKNQKRKNVCINISEPNYKMESNVSFYGYQSSIIKELKKTHNSIKRRISIIIPFFSERIKSSINRK